MRYEREPALFVLASPMTNGSSCWCAAPLAYLISGQAGRRADEMTFQYMDSESAAGVLHRQPLQSLVFDRVAKCAPPVHVYVLLTLGAVHAPSFGGTVKSKPAPTTGEIEAFYYGKGAALVEVVLYNATKSRRNFERMKLDVLRAGSRGYLTSPDRWWQHLVSRIGAQASVPADSGKLRGATYVNQRWVVAREVWQRHLVYRFARERGRRAQYRFFLYAREDTAWLSPPAELASFASAHLCSPDSKPAVVVDENCGWGSYHDKVFLVNAAASDALFGRNYDAFVARLVAWLQLATLPADSPLRPLPLPHIESLPAIARQGSTGLLSWLSRMLGLQHIDPMQSEYMVRTWLHHANVTVHLKAFHRTDVRQAQGSVGWCIPQLYWQCVDPHARARSGLPRCANHPVGRGRSTAPTGQINRKV